MPLPLIEQTDQRVERCRVPDCYGVKGGQVASEATVGVWVRARPSRGGQGGKIGYAGQAGEVASGGGGKAGKDGSGRKIGGNVVVGGGDGDAGHIGGCGGGGGGCGGGGG
eukprot:scaffold2355_cov101-Isochrysis_galbana.AAC.1